MMKKSASARRWEPIVKASRESGLTVKAFAVQHNVNVASLFRWRGRLRDTTPASFVEVPLPTPVAPAEPLRLYIGGCDVSVWVSPGTDLAFLRQVVDALC